MKRIFFEYYVNTRQMNALRLFLDSGIDPKILEVRYQIITGVLFPTILVLISVSEDFTYFVLLSDRERN